MNPVEFLTAELGHAERHLARTRRLQQQMQNNLEQTGLDELKVYETLIASKAYRQLQRDEVFYQQMWLRISRHLERRQPQHQPAAPAQPTPQTVDEILAELEANAKANAKAQPYRKPPTPGRNELCHCGSGKKYKRCCGNIFSLKRNAA